LWVIAALVALEAGIFYLRHRDVVQLSRSASALASDPAFAQVATSVLARDQVSRRSLERIAEVAGRQQAHELQLTALNRIARQAPEEREVELRRADTLRAMGRLDEAELVYARVAGSATGVRP
jgi:hypothetical protein